MPMPPPPYLTQITKLGMKTVKEISNLFSNPTQLYHKRFFYEVHIKIAATNIDFRGRSECTGSDEVIYDRVQYSPYGKCEVDKILDLNSYKVYEIGYIAKTEIKNKKKCSAEMG